jgi:hypothetical protein
MVVKSPEGAKGAAKLHAYWVTGPGLARWAGSPHPWEALHRELARFISNPELLDATVSKWHYEVFHQHTGSDVYRLEHGGKIRGKKVGPG